MRGYRRPRSPTLQKLAPNPSARLGWGRAATIGLAIVFGLYLALNWYLNFRSPAYTDYLSFWAAGRLVLTGDPAGAYEIARHGAIIRNVTPIAGLLPFPYPPPFLIFATPFSLLDHRLAFPAWVIATLAFYLLASRKVAASSIAVTHPAVLIAGFYGQASFFISGLFLGGASLLSRRPFVAGAILGLLIIKPHLAILLPVAVIAGRLWPAIAGAALSGGAFLLIGLLLFGADSYAGFLAMSGKYADMLAKAWWPWTKLISPFAFLRYFGVGVAAALTAHAAIAAAAAMLTWVAWSRKWDERIPILAAASLLISPYLLSYDSLLLVAPLGWLIGARRSSPAIVLIWLLCFFPVLHHFRLYAGPNPVPLAALIALFVLAAPHLRRGSAPTRSEGAATD